MGNSKTDGSDIDEYLLQAAKLGDSEVVRDLLSKGANIDARAAKGETALIFAAKFGHLDIVRLLILAGAATDIKDELGYDAYHAAMYSGDQRGATLEPYNTIMQALRQVAPKA